MVDVCGLECAVVLIEGHGCLQIEVYGCLRVGQCGWLRIGHDVLVGWTVWMCAVCGSMCPQLSV